MSSKPSLPADYVRPKVWEDKPVEGLIGSINRPTAAPRSEKELPRGQHALQLYSLGTPNGVKVTTFLEHAKIEYDAFMIKIMEGDQFR
jgi:GST-like protein